MNKINKMTSSKEIEVIDGKLIVDVQTQEVLFDATETLKSGEQVKVFESGKDLAIGVSLPNSWKTSTNYLNDVQDYNRTDTSTLKKMEVAEKVYLFEGIIGSVVDLMVDMANTEISIPDIKDKKAVKIIDFFKKNMNSQVETTEIGLKSFIGQGMTNWLVYGNGFPYESWRRYKTEDGDRYRLPNIVYLNPLAIEIDRTKAITGTAEYRLNLNKKDASNLKSTSFSSSISSEKNKHFIKLKKKQLTHMRRKPRDWEVYGTSFLVKSFSAVASKRRLRALDDATTEGMINYLTIFKLGSEDKDSPFHKVSLTRLRAFASLISGPNASTTLIWPHDIDVITTGPDGKVLDFKTKYDSVNRDIVNSLGIAGILMDSGDERITEEAALVLIESLEAMRSIFKEYIERLLIKILKRNGVTVDKLEVTFHEIRLSDILQKIKSLVLSYYDRGLLSYETTLTLGGHNFAREVERKETETDVKEKGLFEVPNLPFSKDPNDQDGRPTDKTNTEKSVPDNEVNEKDTTEERTSADQDFIDVYEEYISSQYNKMIKDIANNKQETENIVDMYIQGNFTLIEQVTTSFMEKMNGNDEEIEISKRIVRAEKEKIRSKILDAYSRVYRIDNGLYIDLRDRILTSGKENVVKIPGILFDQCRSIKDDLEN